MANDTKSSPAANAAAAAAGEKKNYYAHKKILHDGNVIYPDGEPLPSNFPADSLKRLLLEKVIGEKPPGETKIERKHAGPPVVVQVEEKTKDDGGAAPAAETVA